MLIDLLGRYDVRMTEYELDVSRRHTQVLEQCGCCMPRVMQAEFGRDSRELLMIGEFGRFGLLLSIA